MKNIILLAVCVLVCFAAGGIGTIFTIQSIPTWYAGLVKPPLNPPNWVFGPVWSTLYTLMGIAIFLIIRKGFIDDFVTVGTVFFSLQLVLNTLWSVIFFGLRNTFVPIFIIIPLWLCILACIIIFWRVSKPAAIMLMPYLLWVGFASYLNIGVCVLNR